MTFTCTDLIHPGPCQLIVLPELNLDTDLYEIPFEILSDETC